MATISIRQMAGCIETDLPFLPHPKKKGKLSLLNDFFGYTTVPQKTSRGESEPVSVRRQVTLLRTRPHINLNIIKMGLDQMSISPSKVDSIIDNAIAVARRAYAEVGIAISRIKRGYILAADARGFEHLESSGEAHDLFDEFSFPKKNGGLDVFLVRSYQNDGVHKGGRSPCDGSCDQKGSDSGVAVVFHKSNAIGVGIVMAHEIGHYLGLDHLDDDHRDPYNIMDEGGKTGTASFTASQGKTMREHCMMRLPFFRKGG